MATSETIILKLTKGKGKRDIEKCSHFSQGILADTRSEIPQNWLPDLSLIIIIILQAP